MKTLPLIYEKRIVVFLDILGFSTMIEDSKVDTPLRRKIKRAVEIIRESADTVETGRAVSTFSDSAVISYPLHKESSLFYLLIDIIHLQLKIGALGIMFRGGIAIGDCFHDGNKRLAITLSAYFLLLNGHMAVAKDFFTITENISYQVAAGKISKELLHRIMTAIMDGTYEIDEELKLEILNAIE